MEANERQLKGLVARARIAPGSKSDHVGLVLRTTGGHEYVLRRQGGNAFRDPVLEELVDATITGKGLLTGETFIMKDWKREPA